MKKNDLRCSLNLGSPFEETRINLLPLEGENQKRG
jgi:hypothetical protein